MARNWSDLCPPVDCCGLMMMMMMNFIKFVSSLCLSDAVCACIRVREYVCVLFLETKCVILNLSVHTYIHTYHSRFIPEGLAEVSQIVLRDTHVLPKLVSYEEHCRCDRW
jgi:hypothetical protein